MRFLVGALSKVLNQFWKQFSNKVLYNYWFFFCVLVTILKSQKLIFHCIFKKWFDLGWVYFWRKQNVKKPNTQEYAQVLVVASQKLKSWKCCLWPPAYIKVDFFCAVTNLLLKNLRRKMVNKNSKHDHKVGKNIQKAWFFF